MCPYQSHCAAAHDHGPIDRTLGFCRLPLEQSWACLRSQPNAVAPVPATDQAAAAA